MLIVLEGCDGCGKSTLAETLEKVMGAEIIHCSQYTPNNYDFFHSIIEASKTKNIIADRFMYGQFVYQEEQDRPLSHVHIYQGGKSALNNLHDLEIELLAAGGKVVHVVAPVEEIKDRLQERGEIVINGISVEDVVARYRGTFKNSILPIVELSTGKYQFD